MIAAALAAATLLLQGEGGRAATLTAAEIAALPHVAVTLDVHGRAIRFEGPLVADLLARVDAPLGPRLRGLALAEVVEARAADGYRVALALSDVDPAVRRERVILADRADGAPLPAADGPFRLVVEGDLRPARAAREVTSLVVRRLPAAGDAPGR